LKKNSLFISIVFLASIILPLVFSDKAGGKISATENRYLAPFPTIITPEIRLAPGIRTGLENWIKDNVGGRNVALIINNTISYKLFYVIPEENVVEGKDNWLYLIPDYDIPNYVNTNIPTQEHLNWLKVNFSRITSDLKKKGIEYTVIIWPYKHSIYPEFFPNMLLKVNNESAIDLLDRELSNNPNFDFMTALNILESGKQYRLVYYKAFDRSHWNQYGAFLGYTVLMKQAQQHLPDLKILTENDFTITPVNKITKTSWGFYTQEEDLQYILKGGNHAHSDMAFFNTFNFISHDPWKSYNYYINSDSSLPKAIIIGDSFIWEFMLPNISESFSELVFINYLDMDNLETIINMVKPDIVISAGLGPNVADIFAIHQYTSLQNLDADIISDTTPSQVVRGGKYEIDVTVKNSGTETWNEDGQIRLAIFQDGFDHYRVVLPDGVEVKPGETYTFKFEDFQAPPEKSTYLEYQMVEEGIKYFGEKKRVNIAIK